MNTGRTSELDQFLAGVERRAFHMARIATQNQEEALDLVQDAMFKLVEKYQNRDPAEWGPLFHRILQHRISDWHRRTWVRNRWRAWLHKKADDEKGAEMTIESLPDTRIRDTADVLSDRHATEALEVALRDLPLRQRQAFFLRAWEGYNVAETAIAMACSAGSVKTHYFRALKTLRLKLKEFAL